MPDGTAARERSEQDGRIIHVDDERSGIPAHPQFGLTLRSADLYVQVSG